MFEIETELKPLIALDGLHLFAHYFVLLQDINVGFVTVVMFAINPSSIFFSACYSETLFCLLTLLGLLFLYKNVEIVKGVMESSVCFALAFITRSNGIFNFGYICYVLLATIIQSFGAAKSSKSKVRLC